MKTTNVTTDALSTPQKGYALHWDDKLSGFGVRVTASGVKSFILQVRIRGRHRRITLGRFGVLAAEQARKDAKVLAGEVAAKRDPLAERAKDKLATVTLGEAFETYLTARKDLKPRTVADMRYAMKRDLSSWCNRPLISITRDMVMKRHAKLGERSPARANLAMRYVRIMFNFAAAQYTDTDGRPLITDNPVRHVSATRAWYRVERRRTVIKPHQLRPWFEAVLSLSDKPHGEFRPSTDGTVRDYLQLLILTGLRNQEAATLKWGNVDLTGKTLTVYDTKNRQDHTLPLSDYLHAMLTTRHDNWSNEFVFPAASGQGHMRTSQKAIAKVTAASGVSFTPHDLRRTFATVADSLDIPGYAVKALLNHKASDVTAGYIVTDVERLRVPMQRITDYMLRAGGLREGAEIVSMHAVMNTA